MPIERVPQNPLPKNYIPGGTPYRVKDGDDWKNVAFRNGIKWHHLIWHNFETYDTDEINWYLRRNTGCNKPTKDGKNWMFSSSAQPGIIYLPPIQYHFETEVVPVKVGKLKKIIPDIPNNDGGHTLHYVLEAAEGLEVGLAIAGVHLGALGLAIEIVGPVAAFVATLLALGNADKDAIIHKKKEHIITGFCYGVVLGADHRHHSFVKRHFVKHSPVYDSAHPHEGKNFQNAYNAGLAAGYAYGKQINIYQSVQFFKDLISRLKDHPGYDTKNWSEKKWIDVYTREAAVFRRDHLSKL